MQSADKKADYTYTAVMNKLRNLHVSKEGDTIFASLSVVNDQGDQRFQKVIVGAEAAIDQVRIDRYKPGISCEQPNVPDELAPDCIELIIGNVRFEVDESEAETLTCWLKTITPQKYTPIGIFHADGKWDLVWSSCP